jgi:hypothetical protein
MDGPLFHDGQAVVCIKDDWHPLPGPVPKKGEIYHVKASVKDEGMWLVTFLEFPSENDADWAFNQEYFAPLGDDLEAEAEAAVAELLREVEEGVLL